MWLGQIIYIPYFNIIKMKSATRTYETRTTEDCYRKLLGENYKSIANYCLDKGELEKMLGEVRPLFEELVKQHPFPFPDYFLVDNEQSRAFLKTVNSLIFSISGDNERENVIKRHILVYLIDNEIASKMSLNSFKTIR